MNEQFCPYCGKKKVNPFGMMFYCPDNCDLRAADAGSQDDGRQSREFKIGDRVVVINNVDGDPSYEIGDIFIIKKFREHVVNKKTLAECRNEDDRKNASIYLEELELCPLETDVRKPGEFKKGDRVRVIKKLDTDDYYDVGDEFYISSKADGHRYGPTWHCTRNLNIDKWDALIYTEELELVKAV